MEPTSKNAVPSADKALARLIAGNELFVRGEAYLAEIARKKPLIL